MARLRAIVRRAVPEKWRHLLRRACSALRSPFYAGGNVICPVCNGHFRKFLPFGLESRPNAQCPKCGCLERHRLLWLYLKDRTGFFEERLRVLDVAPTPFLQQRFQRLKNLDYVSADISSRIAMLKMDITAIDLPADQFDCIICYHVLEHIPDDAKALRELFRVLKLGGWAILQSPIHPGRDRTFESPDITAPLERERAFGQQNHVRIYGKDYRDRLEAAGFVVKVDDYARARGEESARKYGLMSDEMIYFCTKPSRVPDSSQVPPR